MTRSPQTFTAHYPSIIETPRECQRSRASLPEFTAR
jgi:hypothetical protein